MLGTPGSGLSRVRQQPASHSCLAKPGHTTPLQSLATIYLCLGLSLCP